MRFDVNRSDFVSDYQRQIWQFGMHIVPLSVSLSDVEDVEIQEGCTQIYDCTMEILTDMLAHPDDYAPVQPRWYTCDYLVWLAGGGKPNKHHRETFMRFLEKTPQFGFLFDEPTQTLLNPRYPLFADTFRRMSALAKTRKQNMGGYLERRDFRLFAKKIILSLDDLLRPLSDVEKEYFLTLHEYALSLGMKAEMKDPCTFRYSYKKLYSLVLQNNPARISVPYRLSNGGHVHGQFDRFIEAAEAQTDADALIRYIQNNIGICDGCRYRSEGRKTPNERCGQWVAIRGVRRFASLCAAAISRYHRGRPFIPYTLEDVLMLKRMLDIRVMQVEAYT